MRRVLTILGAAVLFSFVADVRQSSAQNPNVVLYTPYVSPDPFNYGDAVSLHYDGNWDPEGWDDDDDYGWWAIDVNLQVNGDDGWGRSDDSANPSSPSWGWDFVDGSAGQLMTPVDYYATLDVLYFDGDSGYYWDVYADSSYQVQPACTIPSSESTTWNGWDSDLPTVGKWTATLLPTSTNFAGRDAREQDPGGGVDYCWFSGSAVGLSDHVSGGDPWTAVTGNELNDDDYVGWTPAQVDYYRTWRTDYLPCSAVFPQSMEISCPDGWHAYTTNTGLGGEVGGGDVTSTKNGSTHYREWTP